MVCSKTSRILDITCGFCDIGGGGASLDGSTGIVVPRKTVPPGFAQHVLNGRDSNRRATGAVADCKFDRDFQLGLPQIR